MNTTAIDPNALATQLGRASSYAAATGTSSTSTTAATTDASTITSADFLTLLVAQLKNQDPTQPTDPTAYVTQLVGVNSLEQLVDINQQLNSLGGTTTSSSSTSSTSGAAAV
jgi:flagellar basal-body rod modification protein FlgD